MSKINQTFLEQTKNILDNGETYTNKRRGVTRHQVPFMSFNHYSKDGFAATGLKKLAFKSVIGELIWFLRGDNHTKYLTDNKIPIWNGDACNFFNKENETDLTELEFNTKVVNYSTGQNYSIQWREFGGFVDQIKKLIDGMKKDIMGARLIVEAWNPSELDKTALPPCHKGFQVVGTPKGFYVCFEMRAWDWFLGAPFNIASYDALGYILSLITGHNYLGIRVNAKCVHLYENQIEPAKELIKRDPNKHDKCELIISDKVKELCKNYDGDVDKIFNNMNIEDFTLKGYTHDEKMKVSMIAPKKI